MLSMFPALERVVESLVELLPTVTFAVIGWFTVKLIFFIAISIIALIIIVKVFQSFYND